MPVPIRKTFPTDRDDLVVQVTDDDSLTLVRRGTDDAYHSGCGAASETRHVYLRGTGVIERLQNRLSTRVLEIGLGTSMAMLMSLDTALNHDAEIDYTAIETDWISATTLEYLEPRRWVSDPGIVDAYQEFRNSLPDQVPVGVYDWQLDPRRRVSVLVSDVRRWKPIDGQAFDAIFYDPFCPENAPELWTAECLSVMRSVIDSGGRLATYSCSRPVRSALEQAEWDVLRVPGPEGGKRQVLIAHPA